MYWASFFHEFVLFGMNDGDLSKLLLLNCEAVASFVLNCQVFWLQN
jgi:hypothetical protein